MTNVRKGHCFSRKATNRICNFFFLLKSFIPVTSDLVWMTPIPRVLLRHSLCGHNLTPTFVVLAFVCYSTGSEQQHSDSPADKTEVCTLDPAGCCSVVGKHLLNHSPVISLTCFPVCYTHTVTRSCFEVQVRVLLTTLLSSRMALFTPSTFSLIKTSMSSEPN
jgi:hypothetical protein